MPDLNAPLSSAAEAATQGPRFLAHSANEDGRGLVEPLAEHLVRVSERAASYARAFGADAEAALAGILHDVGKYSLRFLSRLAGAERGLDHWTPGAIIARKRYGVKGTAVAAAVLGHHVGLRHALPDVLKEELQKWDRTPPANLTEAQAQRLLERLRDDGLTPAESLATTVYEAGGRHVAAMLDLRMLFSALVDSDFVETEAHFNGDRREPRRYRPEGPSLDADRALQLVRERAAQLRADTRIPAHIRSLRGDLFDACLAVAPSPCGLFTLSAPTGTGKTLAMLAFALEHARHHSAVRRIVVVIPYLSIIEQTAAIYRRILEPHFGRLYVLEDHSLTGAERGIHQGGQDDGVEDTARTARLLAENWDAPLVVTTSVQCLESLFANRPAPCRKLHRLARSVILFDEVQTLPPHLAVCTLAALSRMAERYGCTVVFSTATQPAFDHLDEHVRQYCLAGWRPREIVPSDLNLFERARRTRVEWRLEEQDRVSWDRLADELTSDANRQVLCVVNLKRHARALAEDLSKRGVHWLFHLSTNMCPRHRQRVLWQVRRRLKSGQPCLLVSTQCVEAGVDLDFPRVYRAFGPLDAIAQAAGRCNREGRDPYGVVRVFRPDDERYPPGWYKQAAGATRLFLESLALPGRERHDRVVIDDPEQLRAYYRVLYDLGGIGGMADAKGHELRNAFVRRDFADVADEYRVIEQDTINVLVPYRRAAFRRLRQWVDRDGPITRDWIRQAREHAVAVFRPRPDDQSGVWSCLRPLPLARSHAADVLTAGWFVLEGADAQDCYDRACLGLKEWAGQWIA